MKLKQKSKYVFAQTIFEIGPNGLKIIYEIQIV